jgi:predicted nucleic acid-binding protein
MVVVDANVIVYAVFQTPELPFVAALQQKDPDWLLPTLWQHEVASAAATFVRAGKADLQQARAAMAAALSLVGGREHTVDLADCIEAAVAHDLSAYDAQYLVLARSLGVKCVTADQKFLRNAPGITIALRDFSTSNP